MLCPLTDNDIQLMALDCVEPHSLKIRRPKNQGKWLLGKNQESAEKHGYL